MNVTVVPHGSLGHLTVWPAGEPQPLASTLNSPDGRIKANAAIIPGGTGGEISVYASGASTDLVLDVSGYFIVSTNSYLYVPISPCRMVDTRLGNNSGLGAPSLVAGQQRAFEIANSTCNLPPSAIANGGAVAFNVTVVPINKQPVSYVTVWGTSPSEPQTPLSSTLNVPTGTIVANAAIIPITSATSGSVSVFSTENTDLILDITGYFIPATQNSAALSLYTLTPCRVLDTRLTTGEFQGELTVPFTSGNSCSLPSAAQAFVVNATVVPSGYLGFLELWPDGLAQPLPSTLNAEDGYVTSNMAIIGTSNGTIDAFATHETQLVLDTSGYFAAVPGFTLSDNGGGLMVPPGGTATFDLEAMAVNGLNGYINATLTASPGISVSPSTINLASGVPEPITVSAPANAVSGTGFDSTVTVQATSGTISQTLTEAIEIAPNYSISTPASGQVLTLSDSYVFGGFSVAPAPLFSGDVTAQLTGLPPGLSIGTSGFGSQSPTGFTTGNTSVTLYSRCPGNGGANAPCVPDL